MAIEYVYLYIHRQLRSSVFPLPLGMPSRRYILGIYFINPFAQLYATNNAETSYRNHRSTGVFIFQAVVKVKGDFSMNS